MKFRVTTSLLGAALCVCATSSYATDYVLNASGGLMSAGSYAGGDTLNIASSGTVSLGGDYGTNPDGSLTGPVGGAYAYANAGASGYPTFDGGDGVNHFVGGGANYDVTGGAYGEAGLTSTDTTLPGLVRFGTVIGTFNPAPTRTDYFEIGNGASVVVPSGGATLYLLVDETFRSNDSGAYKVSVEAVPEPATFAALGLGALPLLRRRKR